MKLTCQTCGHTDDYGDVGQTAQCSQCQAILDPRQSTQDMRLRSDTLANLRHAMRPTMVTSDTVTAEGESEADISTVDGLVSVTRVVVADKLAALSTFLDANCAVLFEAEDYVSLSARLARANRQQDHYALREVVQLVKSLATRRAHEVQLDITRALEAGELDQARTQFALIQKMTEDADLIRQIGGQLTEATRSWRQAREAQTILDDARRHAAEPQLDSLKQAQKRYQILLDASRDRFSRLPVPFELIQLERDRVTEMIEAAGVRQSDLETATAIAKASERIDDLFRVRQTYEQDLQNGRLERHHVEAQISHLTTSIHEVLDKLVTGHLDAAEEVITQPEYSEAHLRRLELHRSRWAFLSDPVRQRAETEHQRLQEIVARRREASEKSRAAQQLIEQNRPAEAIRQLLLLSGLHGNLKIDVEADIQLAAGMIERRATRLVERIDDALEDDALDVDGIERLMKKAQAEADRLDDLVEVAPQMEPMVEKLGGAVKRGRRLLKSIERTRSELEQIAELTREGRRHEAKTRLERLSDGMPAQCRDDVISVKEKLDVAIKVDEVVARLRRLAATDRAQALDWAIAHPDEPECRAFVARYRFDVAFQEVLKLEERGDDRAALARASEIIRAAPSDLEAFARAEFERLSRVEQHAARVHDILEGARQAEVEGRLDEIWTRFDEQLEVGRSRRHDWHRLRTAAINAASVTLRTKIEHALQVAQAARLRWAEECGFDDDALYVRNGARETRRGKARAHLDEALDAIEAVKLDAEFLRKRGRETIPRELVHLIDAIDLEARLCAIEDHLDRADFAQAVALLPADTSEPRLVRCRARVERLELSWNFIQVIQAGDEEGARRLLAGYPAERTAERTRCAELLRLLEIANAALEASSASAAARLGRVREALIAFDGFSRDEADQLVLSPVRVRLEDTLGRLVKERFDEFERDRLPGAVFRQFELLRQLLMRDGLRARQLIDLQRVVAPGLARGAEAMLTWLERHRGALERLPTDDIRSLQERLSIMQDATFGNKAPDSRVADAVRELEAAWGRANEQKDARERRDALLLAARSEMDRGKIQEAADLERNGGIADKQAHQMLRHWDQADSLVVSIEKALGGMRYDDIETHLVKLEHLDVPHREQASFRHPVVRGRSLSSGTAGIREILDDLRADARQRHAARERAIADSEARIETVWRKMHQVASDSPPKGGRPAIEAYVDSVAPALLEETRALRAELKQFGSGVEAGERTIDTVDSLLQKLPPNEEAAFKASLRELCERFIADYDYLLKCSAGASNLEVVAQRARIEEIEQRWRRCKSPALMWLIRDLSRAWRR